MPKAWVPWFAKPNFVFFILNILNLFNYIDRGIIPGATNEFNEFIENNLHTSTPDVYLGLLQSAFIVGFIVGSILFGHLIHHHPRFYLTGIGVSIWIFAICTSGCAYFIDSYYVLLFGRMMSGFGEAALQCTIPPWIQTTAPESMRGTWLAIFFTAIPVGTALGYVYSSILAGSIGWEWAFFIEAIVVAPAVVFLFMISPHYPLDTEHHQRHESISLNTNTEYPDYAQRVRMSADMDVSPLQLAEEDKLMEEGEENDSSHGTRKSLLGKQNSSSSSPTSLSTELNSDVGAASTASHPNKRTASTGSQQIGSSRSSKSSAAATTTPPPPPSMWNEFKLIIVRPVFFCMTFAYAAQTGVLIGLSTFGSAFFMGLGFFNTESQASTVFGVLISLSGIIFTPMGGVVLDKLNVYSRRKFTESNEQGNMSDALYAAKCDSAVLDNVIILTFWGNAVGAVLMCMIFFIYSEALYMFTIALGAGAIFFCNASINMGLMMAVPLENRAFALAITYASIHAFGDVPSPILAGLLKDTLAPSCVGGNEDDDNVASSKACRDDNKGLRVTMLLISLWLIWTIVGYGMALVLNRTGQKERLLCCGTADTSTIDDDKPSSSIRGGPLDAEEDAFAKEKAFAKVEVYDGNTTQSGGSVKNEEENSSGKGWQSFGSGAGAGGGRESGAAADAL